MIHARMPGRRNGVAAVEFAVTSGVALFLILGLIVGGLGVYRYQEVAHLAREGARYASTHGGQYKLDGIDTKTRVSAISSSEDLRTYLLSKTNLLKAQDLQISVTWSAAGQFTPSNMPSYVDTDPSLVPPGQKVIYNNVTVTVTYQWYPEVYLFGPFNLTSTSTMRMSY